ncbi:unnamed protein product, partial [Candidula unifasciata]
MTDLISSVECPVCGGLFDSRIISAHANSCLNNSVIMDDKMTRKRKSTDWNFLTGSSNAAGPTPANSAKMLKSIQSKGKAKGGTSKTKIADVDKTVSVRNGEDSSSDLEFVDEHDTGTPGMFGHHATVKTVKELNQNSVVTAKINEKLQETSIKQTNTNLFKHMMGSKRSVAASNCNAPLAERARPQSLDNFVGQDLAVGKKCILYNLITHSSNIPSMVLWGPPGCGKTTLAKIIAQKCKEQGTIKFITMSATSASVNDVKDIAKVARNDVKMFHRKTILFLDEIHRFNKTQQDVLLPHVEDGTITLIGATTENPSFYVNSALLSRCRVITLNKLQIDDIKAIIKHALPLLDVQLDDEAADTRQEDMEV